MPGTVVRVHDDTDPKADDESPTLSGAPDGGGLRQAFRGVSTLRVPPPRSVFATAAMLTGLLAGTSVFLVVVDSFLKRALTAPRLAGAGFFGVTGLLAGTISLGLLLRVALDAPTQPRAVLERRPIRLLLGLMLLAVSCGCALLWARGLAAS